MTDKEYRDYRDLSPDPENREGFQYWTEYLIDKIREMSPPTDFEKGTATAINEEFRRLDDVLQKLSPEAKAELKKRELDYIQNEWLNYMPKRIDPDTFGMYEILVFWDIDSSAARLGRFTKEPYQGKRVDARRRELVRKAKGIWIEFKGKITVSEQKAGFYDYVERLVKDTGLKITARTLLRNYA